MNGKGQNALAWVFGILGVLALMFIISKHYKNAISLEDTYINILEKREVLSQIRINLLKSVEMEKDAVMALTDEESQKFADQSSAASSEVDVNLKQLHILIDKAPLQDERKFIGEFDSCWTEFRKLDQTILELAVQNTNLKAASLSVEQGSEAIGRFEHALEEVGKFASGTPDEGGIEKSVCRAITAGLKIYNLHSPHIAEASDEKMDLIEAQMKAEEGEVSRSLDELSRYNVEGGKEPLVQAITAFTDFMAVTEKVIKLSRQNSNIKSLELSLGRKRKITAQCDEVLASFQEAVQSRNFKATR
ncbi:MAG: MCP four helix bundle domain-containing protein [Desulfocapsaceae bacterium]|nr:MCP four helix bundle domain-containing protein [Desulfocapsaceae bacterium]